MDFITLYRKNENGNLGYWEIWTEENVIHTTWGIIGGMEQHSEKEVTKWTNQGRANERDPIAQAEFEAQALWKKRRDNGYHLNRMDALNETIRRSVTGGIKPMKAQAIINTKGKSFEHKIDDKCYVQPKLNGVRVIATNTDKPTLWSSGGRVYTSCRHIAAQIQDMIGEDIILDGEIYKHGLPLQKISGLVRRLKCHSMEDEVLEYHIFDIVDFKLPFYKRHLKLLALKETWEGLFPNIKFVPTHFIDKQDADQYYQKWVLEGYEGMIYRNSYLMYVQKRSLDMIKRKNFFDEEFEIVGANEGEGKLSNCLATWTCVTKDGKEFKPAMNGTHAELAQFWRDREKYIGKEVTVRYLNLTENGIPECLRALHIRPKGE